MRKPKKNYLLFYEKLHIAEMFFAPPENVAIVRGVRGTCVGGRKILVKKKDRVIITTNTAFVAGGEVMTVRHKDGIAGVHIPTPLIDFEH